MPRMTRAKAAEVAEQLHIDEDAVLEMQRCSRLSLDDIQAECCSSSGGGEPATARTPLGEIAPNSSSDTGGHDKHRDDNLTTARNDDESNPTATKRGAQGTDEDQEPTSARAAMKKKTTTTMTAATSAPTSLPSDVDDAAAAAVENILLCTADANDGIRRRAASQDATSDLIKTTSIETDSPVDHSEEKHADDDENNIKDASTSPSFAHAAVELTSGDPASLRDICLSRCESMNVINQAPLHQCRDKRAARPNNSTAIANNSTKAEQIVKVETKPAAVPELVKIPCAHVQENMYGTMLRSRSQSPIRLATPKSQTSSSWSIDAARNATYDELEAAAVQAQTPPRAIRDSPMSQTANGGIGDSPISQTADTDVRDSPMSQTADTDVRDSPMSQTADTDVRDSPISQTADAEISIDDDADTMVAQTTAPDTVMDIQVSTVKSKSKKSAPVVRTTKASQARISLAHGSKDVVQTPSLGRPRQSSAPNDASGKRVASTSSDSSTASAAQSLTVKLEVVIPHSKPRPMSMSFPAPPPPPKSTKAPTQSTFQLPGEAVAAKLKAAKQARLAKEVEEQKKKPFRARPVPATLSKAPPVRHTSSSMARESLINGKPADVSSASRRSSSVANAEPCAFSSSKPVTSRPSSTVPPTMKISARPNTAMANLSKVRVPESNTDLSISTARPPSVAQDSRSTANTSKGKEVFSRPAQAKAAAEKEKREKEEATKKARAEAAERGRQLSREWAEKQRLKKLPKYEDLTCVTIDA